jgi:hypothetical protein
MITTPLQIVNLNGTLRRDCSIFYNDHPLINSEQDNDKKLLEEISFAFGDLATFRGLPRRPERFQDSSQ